MSKEQSSPSEFDLRAADYDDRLSTVEVLVEDVGDYDEAIAELKKIQVEFAKSGKMTLNPDQTVVFRELTRRFTSLFTKATKLSFTEKITLSDEFATDGIATPDETRQKIQEIARELIRLRNVRGDTDPLVVEITTLLDALKKKHLTPISPAPATVSPAPAPTESAFDRLQTSPPDEIKDLQLFLTDCEDELAKTPPTLTPSQWEGMLVDLEAKRALFVQLFMDKEWGYFSKVDRADLMKIITYLESNFLTRVDSISERVLKVWKRERGLVAMEAEISGITGTLSTASESVLTSYKSRLVSSLAAADSQISTTKSSATRKEWEQLKPRLTELANKVDAKLVEIKKGQTASVEISQWKARVAGLELVLTDVEAMDENKVQPLYVGAGSISAEVIKKKQDIDQFRRSLIADLDQDTFASNTTLREQVRHLKQRLSLGMEKIEKLTERTKEKKPVSELTYDELIQEIRHLNPTENDYGRGMDPGRERDAMLAFNQKRKPMTENVPGLTGMDLEIKRHDYQTLRYQYLLKCIDVKMFTPSASTDRSQLFGPKGTLITHELNREELLSCTTHHPTMGPAVRNILRWLIEAPAVQDPAGANFIHKNAYEKLAGESGRAYLSEILENKYPDSDPIFASLDPKRVKEIATLMFTCFDLLSITLQELQYQGRTRAHNTALQMTDPIALSNPLASYIHAGWRYSGEGNMHDWRGWWLLYLDDIPQNGRFGPKGDATQLREMQRLVRLHQAAFFPVKSIIKKIPIPGECESFFPDMYDFITLGPGEKLNVLGQTYDDTNPNGGATPAETAINGFDLYPLAQEGWQGMLEATFQRLPEDLTEKQIMFESADGKGGLFNQWIKDFAGKTKVFHPKHLRKGLEPLLTHFIFRLIAHFEGDAEAKAHLRTKMIKALRESSIDTQGLGKFPTEMNAVIRNISDDEILYSVRVRERQAYVNALWKHEQHSDPPGFDVANPANWFKSPRPIEEHFQQMYRGEATLEAPFQRKGDMLQKEK